MLLQIYPEYGDLTTNLVNAWCIIDRLPADEFDGNLQSKQPWNREKRNRFVSFIGVGTLYK